MSEKITFNNFRNFLKQEGFELDKNISAKTHKKLFDEQKVLRITNINNVKRVLNWIEMITGFGSDFKGFNEQQKNEYEFANNYFKKHGITQEKIFNLFAIERNVSVSEWFASKKRDAFVKKLFFDFTYKCKVMSDKIEFVGNESKLLDENINKEWKVYVDKIKETNESKDEEKKL